VTNIGSVQIRNVATIGGNIVNAVPSADGAIPLITLGAQVRIRGPKGERSMALLDLYIGPGQTLLEPGEILLEFVIPNFLHAQEPPMCKHTRREAMELPLLGVAVLLSFAEDMATCTGARIGLGVLAPTPMRAKNGRGDPQRPETHGGCPPARRARPQPRSARRETAFAGGLVPQGNGGSPCPAHGTSCHGKEPGRFIIYHLALDIGQWKRRFGLEHC